METRTIRLRNLLALADKYKKIIDFCQRIEMNPSYFSQIKNGKKSIGDEIARRVEEKLGIPRGYLDVLHDSVTEENKPPEADSLAIAYSIEAMPANLKETFKRLVHQFAIHCAVDAAPQLATEKVAVEAFSVQRHISDVNGIEVPATRTKERRRLV